MGSVLFKPCDTIPKGCAGGSTWMSQDQGWRPSIPMGTQTGSNLGEVTEIVQSWEQQMVVSHRCRRAVPTKIHATHSPGNHNFWIKKIRSSFGEQGVGFGECCSSKGPGDPREEENAITGTRFRSAKGTADKRHLFNNPFPSLSQCH